MDTEVWRRIWSPGYMVFMAALIAVLVVLFLVPSRIRTDFEALRLEVERLQERTARLESLVEKGERRQFESRSTD